MALSISSSPSALTAQTSVFANQKNTAATLAKLSSGKQINSGQDNAANLAIAVDLIAQLGSSNQDVSNGNDALNVTDTADAALGDTTDILSRLNELAIAAASGSLSNADRANIEVESDALKAELDRVSNATELNGTSLLNANANLAFQIGTGNVAANDQIAVSTVDASTAALGIGGVSLATQSSAQAAIGSFDSALQAVSARRATLGAQANRASSAIASATQTSISLATAASSIRDTDVAAEASNLSRDLILGQAGVSVLAQANQNSQTALRLLGG